MANVRINFFGDFYSKNPNKIVFSHPIKSLIDCADINVCNFEAPIEGCGIAIKKSGPCLSQSADSISFLESNHFNVVTLANNHMMDFGSEALIKTKDAFKSALTIGAGRQCEAYKPRFIEIYGLRIGFIGLTQFEFGALSLTAGENEIGTAWILNPIVSDIIRNSKEKCDFLYVLPHAGIENIEVPLPEWRTIYKLFVDNGADGIIASHPHCSQGWEMYKGKPIIYSLGNFYFDMNSQLETWNKSLVTSLHINTENKEITIEVNSIIFKDDCIDFDNSPNTLAYIKQSNDILKQQDKYIARVNEVANHFQSIYRYQLLRGVNGVSWGLPAKYFIKLLGLMLLKNSDISALLNTIRCESHRWLVERYLLNKSKG